MATTYITIYILFYLHAYSIIIFSSFMLDYSSLNTSLHSQNEPCQHIYQMVRRYLINGIPHVVAKDGGIIGG